MLQINDNKSPKEQRNLFSTATQLKIALALGKDEHTYIIKIRLISFKAVLLFLIAIDVSLKYEGPKTEDINFSFDSFDETECIKRLNIFFERNYSRAGKHTLLFFFLDSSHEISSKSILSSSIENTLYFLSCFENTLQCGEYSLIKSSELDNNLNINKEKTSISSYRTILYEIVSNKDILYISFDINLILIFLKVIFYYKRREEKRENCNPGGGAAIYDGL